MEAFLHSVLSEDDTLAAVVSDRIWPSPPNADIQLAYVLYFRVDTQPDRHLRGSSGLTKYTAQIEYWSLEASTTTLISDIITSLLDNYAGDEVQGCFQTLAQLQESETGFHGVQLYTIWISA